MRHYLLLRNNTETGPFTLEELTAQGLKHSDLIWQEGESTAWKYPTEIEAFQAFAKDDLPSSLSTPTNTIDTSKGIFVALPPHMQRYSRPTSNDADAEPVVLETRFSQPLETLKENYGAARVQKPFLFPKSFSKPHSGFWLIAVFAGLFFAASVIKKMVDASNESGSGIEAAALPATDRDIQKSPDESYQNALSTEVVPVDTITMKPVKKAPVKLNLKKLVHVEANDYQVGLFGGIKNLRLLVSNKSPYVLDNVTIDLDYLKPNSDIINTAHLTMKSIAPKSRKSIAVASKSRGVKVICRISNVQSRQDSERLVSL